MKQFKIGLQLYSVRDAIAADLVGTLKAVKAMGYDYIESAGAGFYGLKADEAKALLVKPVTAWLKPKGWRIWNR